MTMPTTVSPQATGSVPTGDPDELSGGVPGDSGHASIDSVNPPIHQDAVPVHASHERNDGVVAAIDDDPSVQVPVEYSQETGHPAGAAHGHAVGHSFGHENTGEREALEQSGSAVASVTGLTTPLSTPTASPAAPLAHSPVPATVPAPVMLDDEEATEIMPTSSFNAPPGQRPGGDGGSPTGHAPGVGGTGTLGDADDDLETRATREMPSVNLEALGLRDLWPENRSAIQADAESSDGDSNDALEILIDEGELEDASQDPERIARDEVGAPEIPAPETPATGGAKGKGAAQAASNDERGGQRAATVALSDDDLEELIEPIELPSNTFGEEQERRSSFAMDSRRTDPLPVIEEVEDVEDVEVQDVQDVEDVDVTGEDAQAPRQSPGSKASRVPEPGVPAAVAALEHSGMESPFDTPLELGDKPRSARGAMPAPGDSGEILADELLEEVDESDVEQVDVTDEEPGHERRHGPPPAPRSAVAGKPPPSPRQQKQSHKPAAKPAAKLTDTGKARRIKKPWFEEIFDEDYLRTLPFLTPQATQAEALFVADSLGVETGGQLLDVGCGYGRHAMELAARGYVVVALDLSLPLLLRGADEAQRRGLNINFVHGDMRELNFDSQFDGAYCLFSTFGYFDDETNKKTAQSIARALRPGGRLVIEVLNRDYVIAELPTRVWWEGDGCVVLEEVDFNYFSSRVESNRSVVFDDGRQLEQEITLRSYSLHEFGKLLHGAGFRILEVSGSMATRGRFFGHHSRAIIVVAEKRRPQDGKDGAHSGLSAGASGGSSGGAAGGGGSLGSG